MPRVRARIAGTSVVLGRRRIDLRFLRTFRANSDGTTDPRVRVLCRGCRRMRTVPQVGLRITSDANGEVVVDLQPYCVSCRDALGSRDV